MKSFLLGGIAAAVLAGAVPVVAQTPAAQGQPAAKVHTRADVQVRVQKQFEHLDANRDGTITQAEVQTYQATRAQRPANRARLTQRAGDPAQRFARLDTNGDGQIARAEFDARVAARAQRQTAAGKQSPSGERLFARLDTNREGAVSQAEFQVRNPANAQRVERHAQRAQRVLNRPAGARMGGGFGGRMFAMADVNKDGRVTLQEAQSAALQRFDRADANRDGQISVQERQQLRQQMRAQARPQG